MIGHELAIEQRESADLQSGHKPGQCHFRSVAGPREHAFSAKGTANGQAVKTADQIFLPGVLVPQPAFHAVRISQLVQLVKRLLNFGIDPGLPAIADGRGTNRDDVGERGVSAHPETV